MNIAVGSMNPIKIEAVAEAMASYASLAEAKIISINVSSDVSEQPRSIEETIHGAMNRAKKAYQSGEDCTLSVGIESGFHDFPFAGPMELSVCCIYDGKNYRFGFWVCFL